MWQSFHNHNIADLTWRLLTWRHLYWVYYCHPVTSSFRPLSPVYETASNYIPPSVHRIPLQCDRNRLLFYVCIVWPSDHLLKTEDSFSGGRSQDNCEEVTLRAGARYYQWSNNPKLFVIDSGLFSGPTWHNTWSAPSETAITPILYTLWP